MFPHISAIRHATISEQVTSYVKIKKPRTKKHIYIEKLRARTLCPAFLQHCGGVLQKNELEASNIGKADTIKMRDSCLYRSEKCPTNNTSSLEKEKRILVHGMCPESRGFYGFVRILQR